MSDPKDAIDSGIRYCIAHHGIIEQDASVCDFLEDEETEGECVSRPLVYFREAAPTPGVPQ